MERTYKKPDLHKPRKRTKTVDFLAYPSQDPHGFFATMKKQHPNLQVYTNREIANWIKECNRAFAQEVVSNRQGIKLPEGLGGIVAGLCKLTAKTASRNIDFKSSERLGVLVPYQNLHTDGYTAKIYHVSSITQCRFKPCRALSRAVSSAMKSEESCSKYIIFPARKHVADLFRKPKISKPSRKEVMAEEIKKRLLAEHDEFRM